MNLTDWIVIGVLVILAIAGIWYGRKTSCSGNCAKCSSTCTTRNPNEEPDFVKRYRRDHPKKSV